MHRLFASLLLTTALVASAQEQRQIKEQNLGRKDAKALDTSLAGDITREKEEVSAAPALQYDAFRLGVELQVADKRQAQIESLKKIIAYSTDTNETPKLLFRLGELYWEESKYFFFEANRQDDAYIDAMNRKDTAGQAQAKAEKKRFQDEQKRFVTLALEQYKEIVQRHRDFERSDEVLFFLGQLLMEQGEETAALKSYQRLISKYPQSKFLPDAYLAFGEYYFNNSKARTDWLDKALKAYEKAASYPESQIYGYAIYKQGWCYFNLGNYAKAKDRFKAVVLFAELSGAAAVEKDGNSKRKSSLVREARSDFVRAYAREGDVMAARNQFGALTKDGDERYGMLKTLANFYYADGKDREAAITFHGLIQERPLSPEAPGFQGKIVDCVLRAGDKKKTVGQTRKLVDILVKVEGSGVIKDDKDKKQLLEARELAERTLSNLAVNWHKEGQKTRDEETFRYSNEIYKDYLALFGDSPKAYDLRFFWAELLNDYLQQYDRAAPEYDNVVRQDIDRIEGKTKDQDGKPQPPGKYLTNAAYNAILAWDTVVKTQTESGKIKVEIPKDGGKAKIASPVTDLLAASERYVKYVPKGEKRVEVLYKVAQIYYQYNHLDEAIARFSEIAENHPNYEFEGGIRAAEVSANLVLDSYNLKEDYESVNAWATKFYNNPKLARGKFKAELAEVLEKSAFKLVNKLEARKEYAKAAEAYLAFVASYPKSGIAEEALNNASIDFFKAKMLDRSVEVRQDLIRRYPRSKYVPDAIYDNAEALATVGDFEAAAENYELYVRNYEKAMGAPAKGKSSRGKKAKAAPTPESPQKWDEQKAQDSLINAGVLREGLGQYRAAQRAREHYLELWPRAKDTEEVILSIGELFEKQGAHARALKHYEQYQKDYGRVHQKLLTAERRIVRLYEEKLNRPRDAKRVLVRVGDHYNKKMGRTARTALEGEALEVAGMASLEENEEVWTNYIRIRMRWGRGNQLVNTFKEGMQEKIRSRELVKRAYTKTVAVGAPGPAICALTRIGDASAHLYEALVDAPLPPGLPEEVQYEVKAQLTNEAQPLREQAADAYATAVAKSRELGIANACAKQALTKLGEYRPDQFPPLLEVVASLESMGRAVAGRPEGMLAQVQPLPDTPVAASPAVVPGAAGENALPSPDPDVQPARGKKTQERAPAAEGEQGDPFADEPEEML